MSLNKVTIIGNLGKDPEIRSTQQGKEIANFSIATSQRWKDKNSGEQREKSEWHRVVCFSEGLTKIIKQYVKKGSKIYISGALQTRKWTDSNGKDKYTTEIVMQGFDSQLIMLDGKKENNQNASQNNYNQDTKPSNYNQDELDSEVPF